MSESTTGLAPVAIPLYPVLDVDTFGRHYFTARTKWIHDRMAQLQMQWPSKSKAELHSLAIAELPRKLSLKAGSVFAQFLQPDAGAIDTAVESDLKPAFVRKTSKKLAAQRRKQQVQELASKDVSMQPIQRLEITESEPIIEFDAHSPKTPVPTANTAVVDSDVDAISLLSVVDLFPPIVDAPHLSDTSSPTSLFGRADEGLKSTKRSDSPSIDANQFDTVQQQRIYQQQRDRIRDLERQLQVQENERQRDAERNDRRSRQRLRLESEEDEYQANFRLRVLLHFQNMNLHYMQMMMCMLLMVVILQRKLDNIQQGR